MQYREHKAGRRFNNSIDVVIPDCYINVEKGYDKKLKKQKEEIKALVKKNSKRKKTFFWILFLTIAIAVFAIAAIVELILAKFSLTLALADLAVAIAAAIAVALPVSNNDERIRLADQIKRVKAYSDARIQFKQNEYLYGVLTYTRIDNLIMSGGTLTVFYIGTDEKPRCDTFHYKEWEGDEDFKTPFLVFENDALYGRSDTQAESTSFSTQIVDE